VVVVVVEAGVRCTYTVVAAPSGILVLMISILNGLYANSSAASALVMTMRSNSCLSCPRHTPAHRCARRSDNHAMPRTNHARNKAGRLRAHSVVVSHPADKKMASTGRVRATGLSFRGFGN
jgi:hypothetical protein